jgi:predicted ArsR family transcriptional regulator
MPTAEKQAAFQFIDPKRPSIRKRIVELLSKCNERGLTAKEISAALSVKRHTVTGRIDELWDEGTVHGVNAKDSETRYCMTRLYDISRVSNARRKEKFKVWLAKGRERYGNVIPEDVWDEIFNATTKFN